MKFGIVIRGLVLIAMLALGGCATTNPKDPFEPYNRAAFAFNDAIDKVALKPTAQLYSNLPSFVQTGIGNFFGNLNDVWTAANNFMQGKVEEGISDVMRVAMNTTFGVCGLVDFASEAGLAKHREDFGQTLGTWGVKPGPYLVLPLLGSSTLRDTVALPLDFVGDPWAYVNNIPVRNTGYGVRLVDRRAALLGASGLLEDAALDRYEFIRDAYMQRRESLIRDGESPRTSYEDDDPTQMDAGNAAQSAQQPVAKQENGRLDTEPASSAATTTKEGAVTAGAPVVAAETEKR